MPPPDGAPAADDIKLGIRMTADRILARPSDEIGGGPADETSDRVTEIGGEHDDLVGLLAQQWRKRHEADEARDGIRIEQGHGRGHFLSVQHRADEDAVAIGQAGSERDCSTGLPARCPTWPATSAAVAGPSPWSPSPETPVPEGHSDSRRSTDRGCADRRSRHPRREPVSPPPSERPRPKSTVLG